MALVGTSKRKWRDLELEDVVKPENITRCRALAADVVAGDPAARTKFWKLFENPVWRCVCARVCGHARRKELFHFVMIRLITGYRYKMGHEAFGKCSPPLRAWLNGDPDGKLLGFVDKCTKNYLIDLLKSEAARVKKTTGFVVVSDDGEPGDLVESIPDPQASVDSAELDERRRWVREAVARLPESEQAVIRPFLEGLTQAEIARKLGLSEATVSDRYKSARSNLERHLRDINPELCAFYTDVLDRPKWR